MATPINKEKSTSSQTLSKTHDDVSVTVEARGTHKVEPRGTHKVEPVASLGVESMDKNCSGPWPNHSQCEDKMQVRARAGEEGLVVCMGPDKVTGCLMACRLEYWLIMFLRE